MTQDPMKPDPITSVCGSSPRDNAARLDTCTRCIIRASVVGPGAIWRPDRPAQKPNESRFARRALALERGPISP